jgi:hypothetical protein
MNPFDVIDILATLWTLRGDYAAFSDYVGEIPDSWRLVRPVFSLIVAIARANGWTVWEDGSVSA